MISLFAWGLLLTKMYQLKVGSAIWTEASTNFGQLPLGFMYDFRQEMGMLQWKCRHVQVWAVSECLLLGVLQGKEGSKCVNCGSFSVMQQCYLPTLQLCPCWLAHLMCPEQVNGFGEELIQSAWYVWSLIKCVELKNQFMECLETAVLRVWLCCPHGRCTDLSIREGSQVFLPPFMIFWVKRLMLPDTGSLNLTALGITAACHGWGQ